MKTAQKAEYLFKAFKKKASRRKMEENKTQTPTPSGKPYNLAPNVEAALSYIWFLGIIVFLLEKENKFVKFHAAQSLAYAVVTFVVGAVIGMVPVLGWAIAALMPVATIVYAIFLGYKAYNNEEYEIPYLGKFVREKVLK